MRFFVWKCSWEEQEYFEIKTVKSFANSLINKEKVSDIQSNSHTKKPIFADLTLDGVHPIKTLTDSRRG